MPSDYRPRLSVDITHEQRDALDRILAHHGLQKAVFNIIIDDLIEAVNKYGQAVIAGLLSRALSLGDISKEANRHEHRRSEPVHLRDDGGRTKESSARNALKSPEGSRKTRKEDNEF